MTDRLLPETVETIKEMAKKVLPAFERQGKLDDEHFGFFKRTEIGDLYAFSGELGIRVPEDADEIAKKLFWVFAQEHNRRSEETILGYYKLHGKSGRDPKDEQELHRLKTNLWAGRFDSSVDELARRIGIAPPARSAELRKIIDCISVASQLEELIIAFSKGDRERVQDLGYKIRRSGIPWDKTAEAIAWALTKGKVPTDLHEILGVPQTGFMAKGK